MKRLINLGALLGPVHLATVGLCVVLSFSSQARETVSWLTDDREDLVYLNQAGAHSIGVDTLRLVLGRLKQFDIHLVLASVPRINNQLQSTGNSCVANRIKTPERAAYSHFSLPVNLHPTVRLYFNQIHRHKLTPILDKQGKLSSLRVLFEHLPTTKLSVIQDVSYGPEIDQLLGELAAENMLAVNADNRFQMSSKLLFEGMVDFTLDYPTQMERQVKAFGIEHNAIGSVGLSVTEPFVLSYIACSLSPLGHSVIQEVNKVLLDLYSSQAFIEAHTHHVPEEYQTELKQQILDVTNQFLE